MIDWKLIDKATKSTEEALAEWRKIRQEWNKYKNRTK